VVDLIGLLEPCLGLVEDLDVRAPAGVKVKAEDLAAPGETEHLLHAEDIVEKPLSGVQVV
jgi:hypothetical protein